MTTFDPAKIEEKLNASEAGAMPVSMEFGGIRFERMIEIMDFAKIMALSHTAIPPYLRGNPGDCMAILLRALRWKIDPYAVAEQSYKVTNKGVEAIAYMSQLLHAVIETNAPIKGRLRYEIVGEGDERKCKVWATFKNEDKPHEYMSATLKELREARGRNEYGNIKGSPLWDTNPEVQMFYSASRQWARLYAPDILLGAYPPEEADQMVDVTPPKPQIGDKLRSHRKTAAKGKGFDHDHVARTVDAATQKAEPGTVVDDGTVRGQRVGLPVSEGMAAAIAHVAHSPNETEGDMVPGPDVLTNAEAANG